MNKKGFVSTALIYTFFILFLILMLLLLGKYSRTRFLLERYKSQIKEDMFRLNSGDINLYFMVFDEENNTWTIEKQIPRTGYVYESGRCKNNSPIEVDNNTITVNASGKDTCIIQFKKAQKDIELKIYAVPSDFDISDLRALEAYSVKDTPSSAYSFSSCTCDLRGATCDYQNGLYGIQSDGITTCRAIFKSTEGE